MGGGFHGGFGNTQGAKKDNGMRQKSPKNRPFKSSICQKMNRNLSIFSPISQGI